MKKTLVLSFVAAFAVSSIQSIKAAAFTAGDLAVVLDGDGVAALSSAASAAFVREYTTAGSFVQTIALPTAAVGGNSALTLSGSATSEGFLSLSTDGKYLTLGGYGAAPGTAGVATATPATVNRVVGVISANGTVSTTTALADAYSGSNIRSTASTDGSSLWTAGNGGSGQGATAGVRSTTSGSTSSVQLNSTTSNNRVVNIFNGQLYVSAASGTFLGVGTVGTGLPTTGGSGALTLLPGMPTTGTHSPYDFWFRDTSTLYVADDGTAATGGGIQKWILSGGTWLLAYTLLNTGTTTTGVRGLIGTVDGSGNTILYATTSAASQNLLISLTDPGVNTSTFTTLATAPVNTAFRGIDFAPTPEPSAMALAALGSSVCLLVFRRKR